MTSRAEHEERKPQPPWEHAAASGSSPHATAGRGVDANGHGVPLDSRTSESDGRTARVIGVGAPREGLPAPEGGATTSGREGRPPWRRALAVLAAVGLAIAKYGAKLKGLLLLLPKVKFLSTSASMLVSVAAYALLWGWKFAVGFVLLLLVHELGHVVQLRREGIRATAPMFIPFLGAVVGMKELPRDAAAEARVGLAGPVLGSLGCLVPVALHAATGDDFWAALAFTGFFLNLFNLAPMVPLDGGRAMAALSPWMWLVGLGVLVGVGLAFPNPIVLLIIVLGAIETWRRWRRRNSPEGKRFYRVRPRTRLAVAAVYVGLAVLLILGMDATYVPRSLDDV